MKITFILVDEQHINIVNEGKIIGHIFTPSGTTKDEPNAIQVCGFEDMFDYWACGIFGDGKGNPKKDIQLWFDENSRDDYQKIGDVIEGNSCGRCFRLKEKCICNNAFKSDLRHEDLIKDNILRKL